MEKIIKRSKNSLKLVLKIFLACLLFSLLFFISSQITINQNISLSPFVSPFIHGDIFHLFTNLIFIFVSVLHPINQGYKLKEIYIISFFIALLYLPISLLEITPIAIGLSGTGYFLMSRACFNWGTTGKVIIIGLTISELFFLSDLEDGIAHGVHLIGIILGYISLKKDLLIFRKEYID